MNNFASIIITHHGSNPERSAVMRQSLESLSMSLDYPAEIIVVDNGGSDSDTDYLLNLTKAGKINTYIRNNLNMHFGYARNQAIAISNGGYVCIADNDIFYDKGWLTASIKILEAYPKAKIYATPMWDKSHALPQYWSGDLKVGDETYLLNMRAGSNCFVIRYEDLRNIGWFSTHRIAGSWWSTRAVKMGYLCAVTPKHLVHDMGFRNGYNMKEAIPIKEALSDGSEIYFNRDEFKRQNRRTLPFILQRHP